MAEKIETGYGAGLISRFACLIGAGLIAACLLTSPAAAQTNLLCNSDLSAGSGDSPQCWTHDAYTQPPGDVTFDWLKDQQPAELEVWNYQPLDSRWKQTVHLKPGWYHFSAEVRTENVGEVNVGANLSLMETWIMSRNVQGSSYWEPVGFYLEVPKETNVVLALRLGFYSSENTGRVYFRNPGVTQVSTPGADAPSFKLEDWYYSTSSAKQQPSK
jgi:hypothetical protein